MQESDDLMVLSRRRIVGLIREEIIRDRMAEDGIEMAEH